MHKPLPYFDYLLAAFEQGHPLLEDSFGRHVHWGYWEFPEQARADSADFAAAAENLSRLVQDTGRAGDGQTVLDAGCGFGGTLASLNERYENLALKGLNIDERQLVRARQLIQPRRGNRIGFHHGDACALPFADASFDTVLAVECIFHFPSREKFFAEAFRVLKPGGYLAISDFLLSPGLNRFAGFKPARFLSDGFFGACDVGFTPSAYRELASEVGFSVELEQNITRETLPTYRFLRGLAKQSGLRSLSSYADFTIALTVLSVEWASRLDALRYFVFAFKKPAA